MRKLIICATVLMMVGCSSNSVIGGKAIPDVTGLDQKTAQLTLQEAGFKYELVKEESEAVPSGITIRTNPARNTKVSEGSVVKLIVSSGVDYLKKLTSGERDLYNALVKALPKFYNPSAVRVIGGYDSVGKYLGISGTNKLGGTVKKCYYLYEGELSENFLGWVYQCEERLPNQSEFNKALEKYIEENY